MITKFKWISWAGPVADMAKNVIVFVLNGTHEGKRPPGRPRHFLVDNTKVAYKWIGWECVDWIHLAHDEEPVTGFCQQGNELSGYLLCKEF
jgi:predicted small integral membrane protein